MTKKTELVDLDKIRKRDKAANNFKTPGQILSKNISFRHVVKCPQCNKKVKGYRKVYAEDRSMFIELPVFNCVCIDNDRLERAEEKQRERTVKLYRASNIDNEFLENDFPIYHPKILEHFKCLEWLESGRQFLIYGDPGNHKTGHVTALAKRAMKAGYSVYYCRASELPTYARESVSNMRRVLGVDLLILDNFAKEEAEKFGGINFDILDKRIHRYKTNILIVNAELSNIGKIYKDPMVSRLSGFIQFAMDGGIDHRKKLKYGR